MTEARKYISYSPAVDVFEAGHGWVMLMDLPGATQEMLDVNVEDKVLTVGAETNLRENELAVKYTRSFNLSDEVDSGSIKAILKNGVLELTLPKAESAKPRKIAVIGA